jgi:hypothetical protein
MDENVESVQEQEKEVQKEIITWVIGFWVSELSVTKIGQNDGGTIFVDLAFIDLQHLHSPLESLQT